MKYVCFTVGKANSTVRSPPVNLSRINQSAKGDSKVLDELTLQVCNAMYLLTISLLFNGT